MITIYYIIPFVCFVMAVYNFARHRISQGIVHGVLGLLLLFLLPQMMPAILTAMNVTMTNSTSSLQDIIGMGNETPCPQGYMYNRDTSQCLLDITKQTLNTTHVYDIYYKTYGLYGGK